MNKLCGTTQKNPVPQLSPSPRQDGANPRQRVLDALKPCSSVDLWEALCQLPDATLDFSAQDSLTVADLQKLADVLPRVNLQVLTLGRVDHFDGLLCMLKHAHIAHLDLMHLRVLTDDCSRYRLMSDNERDALFTFLQTTQNGY